MIKKLKQLNEALPGLVAGIIIFGLLVEVCGVWFSSDKLRYTIGAFIGTACAVYMAINIAQVIVDSVSLGEGHEKLLALKSVLRYLIVVAVFFAMMFLKIGEMLPAIISLLGLKVSAYAQPLINKIIFKSTGGEERKN